MGTLIIIIRYCCGKQCELLVNRFLIRDLHHKLYLFCHLPLSYIIDDKIRLPPLFQPRVENKISSPHLVSQPHLKKFDPYILLDNSNTGTLFGLTPISMQMTSTSSYPSLRVFSSSSVCSCSGRDDVEVVAVVLRLVANYLVKVRPASRRCPSALLVSLAVRSTKLRLVVFEGDWSAVRNGLPRLYPHFKGFIFQCLLN